MDFDDILAIIILIFVATVIIGIFALVANYNEYDYVEKELVQAVVIDKYTHGRIVGKIHKTIYCSKFKYEDIETEIEGSSLYNNLEINDEITMNKCIYYKDGEVIRIELEIIK